MYLKQEQKRMFFGASFWIVRESILGQMQCIIMVQWGLVSSLHLIAYFDDVIQIISYFVIKTLI